MNNKANIFEELNKMKGLIHAKSGTVISEQPTDITADIEAIKSQMSRTLANVDEQTVVDILKKYATDKTKFRDFLNQYQSTTGFKLTDQLPNSFQSTNDSAEINDLNSVLQKIGVKYNIGQAGNKIVHSFEGLTPVQDGLAAYMNTVGSTTNTNPVGDITPRQKNINFNYCSVKNGKIENAKSAFNGKTFDEYVSTYTITPEEIAAAKATCPDVESPAGYKFGDDLSKALNVQGAGNNQKGNTNAVNTRFKKSATDLGVQSDKMDLQTLQSILAKLQDDGSQSTVTQSTSTTTQQTPDLTQLTTLLNQLKA